MSTDLHIGAPVTIDGRGAVLTHEPTRAGLEHATGLLAVDHPSLWRVADLVNSATRRHAARLAGEAWARSEPIHLPTYS